MNPPLSVKDAILHRRSVKTFKPDPLPAGLLDELIHLALEAPSSFNLQPTRLVVIQDPGQKTALSAAAWDQKQILQAPVTFVFAASIRGWEQHLDAILQQARQTGAWSGTFADFAKTAAPDFQNGLSRAGLEREYAIKDALIAATTLALAAESAGLGSCFMNGWDETAVKKIIGAADNPDLAIALVLPVGYVSVAPAHPGRLPKQLTVFRERLE
jgi:nitroreductase